MDDCGLIEFFSAQIQITLDKIKETHRKKNILEYKIYLKLINKIKR